MRAIKILLVSLLVAASMATCMAADRFHLVQSHYVVREGDTLDSIALAYIKKNTYGKRDLEEFKEGIRELNNIEYGEEVYPGEDLRINYWVKVEEAKTE